MASISVKTFNRTFIDEAENQAKVRPIQRILRKIQISRVPQELSSFMADHNGIRVSYEIWPFHKDAFKGVKRGDCAWPHEEGNVFGPLIGWFQWSGKDNDKFWLGKIKNSLDKLRQIAVQQKCTTENLPVYLSIALEGTSAKDIYRDHYEELERIRHECDPDKVMGLAAGFSIGSE